MYLIEFDHLGKGIDGRFLYMDQLSFDVIEVGDEPDRSNKPVSNAA